MHGAQSFSPAARARVDRAITLVDIQYFGASSARSRDPRGRALFLDEDLLNNLWANEDETPAELSGTMLPSRLEQYGSATK